MEGSAEASRLRFRRDEVTPDLFATLGTPLRRGRAFTADDRAGAPPVAIINEAMAAALWPGRDAIGKRFKLGGPNVNVPWFTVVGVVANMRRQGLETQPNPQLFEPLSQNPSGRGILLVRTSVESPLGLQGLLQAAVHRVDPRAVVYGAAPLDQRMDRFLQPRRLESVLLLGFALAALLIAAIGIYGLMQYSIATRTREIAIRLAIGARPAAIFLMIMGEGLKLTLAGLAIGLAGAMLLGRTISSLLYEVSSADPLTFGAVSVFLVGVAMAACYLPARRVMRLEPMDALRLQ
jgi:putative ABC transport system permease protein